MGVQNNVAVHGGSTQRGSTWGFNTRWIYIGFQQKMDLQGFQHKVDLHGVQHKVALHGISKQGCSTLGFNDSVIVIIINLEGY